MHQLTGALRRPAQRGELVDQLDRPLPVRRARRHPRARRQRVQRPVLPRGPVGGDEHVDVGPRRHRRLGQEPRALQLGGGLVQAHRGGDDLVVAGFGGAGDEGVRAPARRPRSGRRSSGPAGPAAPRRRTASRGPSPTRRRGRGRRPSTARPRRSASRPPSSTPSGTGCTPVQAERRQHMVRRPFDSSRTRHSLSGRSVRRNVERSVHRPCRVRVACAHATMPPCRCSASEKPAFFTTASASADRTPVLQ